MTTLSEVSQHHPAAAHCDALYEVRDDAVGLHAFIALHDLSRGPGYGGVRRRVFATVRQAVAEVVALAEQMTLKTALADLPAGGAKAVILDRPELATGPLYEAFGRAVESLGGIFFAGPDVGTSDEELGALRHTSRFVSTAAAEPSRSTARGVVAACLEALEFLGIEPRQPPEGVFTAVVQGVGSVGRLVASELAALGGRLAITDLDEQRARASATALGATVLSVDEALSTPTLLFVPCGVGPVVTTENVGGFRARVICGAANHQLELDTLAHELAERQVLYVPDFAANAGAVVEGVVRHTSAVGDDLRARVAESLAAIGPRIRRILDEARAADITPLEAALSRVDLRR